MCAEPRVLQFSHDLYAMIMHPSVLQKHIREGNKYFPDDIDKYSRPLLGFVIHHRGWEAVRVLLELWENLLPHQGLPRAIGYGLRRGMMNLSRNMKLWGLYWKECHPISLVGMRFPEVISIWRP
ncbi:hypothetical protein FSHL1_011413 [Fusarium sambucinum]